MSGVSFNVGQLAGGMQCLNEENAKGLNKFVDRIRVAEGERKRKVEEDGKALLYTIIALAILATIAAAGAATLLAYSGGPSNAHLFYTGIALGIVSLLLIGGVIYRKLDADKFKITEQVKVTEAAIVPVSEKEIVQEMEECEKENVAFVMKELQPEQRQKLFKHICEAYVTKEGEPQPLTDKQKKVLSVVAQYPEELEQVPFEGSRDLAREILREIAPEKRDACENLISKLVKCVGAPEQSDIEILIQSPEAVAEQMLANVYSPEQLQALFVAMNFKQQARFLKTVADSVAQMGNDKASEKESIRHYVEPLLRSAINENFIRIISGAEPADEAAKKEFEEATLLLTELARWPIEIAQLIYLSGNRDLLSKPRLIDLIYSQMDKTNSQEIFIKHVADHLPENHSMDEWINNHIDNKWGSLPVPTMLIYARKPVELVNAMRALNGDHPKMYTDVIINQMTPKQFMAFLEAEKAGNNKSFVERMLNMLLAIKKGSADGHAESAVVDYFIKHPHDFKPILLDNDKIGNEDVRAALALDLLEKMDAHAEEIIKNLDNTPVPGYRYFNWLINYLVMNTKAEVSQTRARLVARFRHAPQFVKSRDFLTIFGVPIVFWGKPLKTEGPEWDNFERIAQTKEKAGVWQ